MQRELLENQPLLSAGMSSSVFPNPSISPAPRKLIIILKAAPLPSSNILQFGNISPKEAIYTPPSSKTHLQPRKMGAALILYDDDDDELMMMVVMMMVVMIMMMIIMMIG